ncbi:MAG: 4Fe-4S binding protein [Candidatus Competibacterales bacterium]|nr:4Fe-4S binding protein [Candidatus Competibacterales bacterium]
MVRRQRYRLLARSAFFALFVLAPPLNLLRLDLNLGHFILFGQDWTLGLAALQAGRIGPPEAIWNLVWRGFLPIALVVGGGLFVAWKYGRLYCGWLCPHFSVVETINALMLKASGRPTLWERKPLPARRPDGRIRRVEPRYWLVVAVAVAGFAFLWALTLLTYLLTPAEVYRNLLTLDLPRNQALFLGVATTVFVLEFTLARHLFCRFGCAVGLFQSIAWMANRRALVVGFDRRRASACADCFAACDHACPMRLKPRSIKRRMFTCTQCTACVSACEQVQAENPRGPLLHWVQGAAALEVSDREHRARIVHHRNPQPAG